MLKTNFNPNDFVAASQVAVTVVGHITVSTVRLPKMKADADRWETCLFDDTNDSRSDVVALYSSKLEAQVNHTRIVNSLKFAMGK
jgi:hypothetical protein